MAKQNGPRNYPFYLKWEFRLKIVGGAILLVSFITQNFLYDQWNSQTQDSETAAVDQSLIDKSTLLNEALFFTARTDESINPSELQNIRRQYIRQAAVKSALAKTVWILASGLDRQQKVDLANSLMQRANAVTDLASFSEFNKSVNELDDKYAKTIENKLAEVRKNREISRTLYLGAYCAGAVLIAFSLWFERKRILTETKQ